MHPHECGRIGRFMRHPPIDENPGPYHIRNDKQTNIPVLVSKVKDLGSGGFLQNSTRRLMSPPARAADAAVRRLSRTFHLDTFSQKSQRQSNLFEMDTRLDSYQRLDSETDLLRLAAGDTTPTPLPRSDKTGRFRWSRIRENLGRDPPQTPLAMFDLPLYKRGVMAKGDPKKSSRSPQDDLPAHIPRLPFPLISLPEAAKLQYVRRERGEEDHTDPGASFASKGRSNTISTISSSVYPQTPLSARFDGLPSPLHQVPLPAHVHHGPHPNEVLRRRDCK